MADVDGQIVLGLNISATTSQINADLTKVLRNISAKEIVLNARIGNINMGNASSQIRNVTNQINNEFTSTLNVIDLVNGGIGNLSRMLQGAGFSKGSIATVTQDLQQMSLQIGKITTTMAHNGNITLKINGTDEMQRAVTIVRQYNSETGNVINTSKTFVQSFENTAKSAGLVTNQLEKVMNAVKTNQLGAQISNVSKQYQELASSGHSSLATIQSDIESLRQMQQTLTTSSDPKVLIDTYDQYTTTLGRVKNALSIVSDETKKNTAETQRNAQAHLTLEKSATLSNKISAWMDQNTKAAKRYGDTLRELQSQLSNNTDKGELSRISAEFARIQSEAKSAGLVTNQFAQNIKNVGLQLLGLGSSYMVIKKIISLIKEGVDAVVELDTALIDLKKTTTMSDFDLASFYKDANTAAKELGVTTKDIIQSAADWSRLGFSDKSSAESMAKLAAQMAAISPGVNIENATTGLVSVMKAYDIDVNDVLDGIMSKINIIGNTAATSNEQIIQGLQNSASAMAAMNSTLDENIALFTAAQEITQDASKVGNALRTISMRIRGYDEETEQLSDDLVNINGVVVDLTKTASNPNGISLFTDETQTEYKSIYSYLKEISEIYDELGAKQQQQLMEKLFGKMRASIGQAILQNFSAAEKAMDNMANSAGNADKEMGIIMESLEYKLNALKETGVGIFQDMFSREDVGVAIDVLTTLLNAIGAVTGALGPFGTALAGVGITAFVKNLD